MKSDGKIAAVATHIITGFLGVGKTSAILHLLQHKPEHERWAILVNEFGEIGIDGSLMQGQPYSDQQVYIREVPGGCMCCAAGVPMQVALNQLLAKAKPDRLLIEPTGLGHPKEVLQVLSSAHYREVLDLQKTVTLVDARKLSDERYTNHATFNQQIAIADTVIGNKTDLYQSEDKQRLQDYVDEQGQPGAEVIFCQYGEISPDILTGRSGVSLPAADHQHHHGHNHSKTLAAEADIPACGYIKAENQGEGFHSIGWRFAANKVFSRESLSLLLTGLAAERVKAVFITDEGVIGYNLTADTLTEIPLTQTDESRLECIAEQLDPALEAQLLACLIE